MRLRGHVQLRDGSVRFVEARGSSYEAARAAVQAQLSDGEELLAVVRADT